MTNVIEFRRMLALCPIVAIIRGVKPEEAEAIGEALVEGGIRIIEVPLNSPEPLKSIEKLARRFDGQALIGAGTVLTPAQVGDVRQAGGRLIVSPNSDSAVIGAAVSARLVSVPGFFTPTEAFSALGAGAHALKLFPAEAAGPAVVKAQRAVLPRSVPLLVVGGVTPDLVAPYLAAGADGFGLGSSVYSPGQDAPTTLAKTNAFVQALAASVPQ